MNNIASIYAEQKKDKKALEIYQKILRENSKNKTLEITVMGNIASIYSSMKDTVSAIVYYDKALKLCEGTGDIFQKIKILLNKCNLLLEQKRFTTIEDDLKNIFRISKESGWPDITAKSARLLSQLYEKQHYFKKSLLYLTDYVKYSEIEENKENAKKIAEIQLRYDLEKETLEVEAKSHRKSILLICILIVSSVSISYILTLLIHFRTRAVKVVLQQKNLELEQERLKLEHQNMTNKLELSNKEVVSNVMLLQKKNDLLNSVAEQLLQRTNLFTKPNREIIENFVKELQQSVDDLGWQSIEKPFNQVYESFYKNLDAINPNLTINDRRLCAYIKLKMRSKEIAQVVNATPRSVEIARYRLRKKLGITNPTISLSGFLERL
jgi:tetratricopeptide (TPR) repeat protein